MLIVTFSGAGLSKESGIPTFRDSDGLWHGHKVEDVASPEGWKRDRKKVLKFYEDRAKNVKDAKPNAAHYAIASLQEKHEVINFTQNIDDLLERAGCKTVYHMHGSLKRKKCEFHENIFARFEEGYICYYEEEMEDFVKEGELCPVCRGHLRPDVVWFHEAVDMKSGDLFSLATRADVFIGVGTSAQVQPAASILSIFNLCDKKYFVDPNPPGRLQSWRLRKGVASVEMVKLAEELLR